MKKHSCPHLSFRTPRSFVAMTTRPTATPFLRPEVRRTLRRDQQHAVDSAVRHLKRPGSRGHIVSACGTGKTLTALRTAEALNTRHLLVAVPSLDLIGQWAAVARADAWGDVIGGLGSQWGQYEYVTNSGFAA
ncbi:DEAD/DEAH box helicase family protein (plasmid) [Streptomyces sp. NBC_01362]|uniref:DEAD/DEAH box helicase family protein n=1 Tax=Streptomyces sp. NBC_01362 TaxID=2903839 RepID=UPI003FCE1499